MIMYVGGVCKKYGIACSGANENGDCKTTACWQHVHHWVVGSGMAGLGDKSKDVPGEEDRRQRAIRDFVGQAEWEFAYEELDGEVIYRCDRCGGSVPYKYPFCPWCGREMINSKENE